MKRSEFKPLTGLVLGVFLIGLASCNSRDSAPDIGLDAESPFELNWRNSNLSPDSIIEGCDSQLRSVAILFKSTELNSLEKICLAENYENNFYKGKAFAQPFKDGEIGVLQNGLGEPIIYTYSFMHELDPTYKSLKLKKSRASGLKKTLQKKYGRPTATGVFDETDRLGFIPKGRLNDPCYFWIQSDTGIVLCRERKIYMDGYEMSLSFIRMDTPATDTYGGALRNRIENYLKFGYANQQSQEGETDYYYEKTFSGAVDTLAKWMDITPEDCIDKSLKPLEEAWQISEGEKARISPILKKYKGVDLAEYLFEDEGVSRWVWKNDNVVLFLLKTAAEGGSADAMNEFAYVQMRCKMGVEKDWESAKIWIDKAVERKSGAAFANRALITAFEGPPGSVTRTSIITNLKICFDAGHTVCGNELGALETLNAMLDPSQ